MEAPSLLCRGFGRFTERFTVLIRCLAGEGVEMHRVNIAFPPLNIQSFFLLSIKTRNIETLFNLWSQCSRESGSLAGFSELLQ